MLSRTDIVKTFITAVQSGELDMASDYMADDFVCTGFTRQPLDKGNFLAVQSEFRTALSGYAFNLSNVQEQGERGGSVEAYIQVTGNHTHDLALPLFGIPLITPTGIIASLPQQRVDYTFKGEQIAQMNVESVPGGGLQGLLQQLGSDLAVQPRLREYTQMADNSSPTYQEIIEHVPDVPPWNAETTIMDEDANERKY